MQLSNEAFNEYVKESIDAGIAPLELVFFPIVDFDAGYPVAYRTETVIHSVMVGELPEKEYVYVSDKRDCGVELLKHNIQHMITAVKGFRARERNVNYVSIRCPSEIAENADLYKIMSAVIRKNPSIDPQSICLEFPASLLLKNTEKVRTAVLDMKLLKIRTAITGCGTDDFPLSKLLTVTPDIAVLDPSVTAYAGSRDKPQLLSSLVSYVRSMGCEVVAKGSEAQRKQMRNTECIGFLDESAKGLTLDEAFAQKEDDLNG